jgi:hypothetical protein
MGDDHQSLSLGIVALLFAAVLVLQRGPLIRYLKIERM